MAFTPSPGTGDLIDVNPEFTDPANGDFSLQSTSPAIASGRDNYDRGAIWYVNRPMPVMPFDCVMDSLETIVYLNWDNPYMNLDSSTVSNSFGAKIWRNDSLIAELNGLFPASPVFVSDTLPGPGYYSYTVSVYDTQGFEGIRRKSARTWAGGPLSGIVVWSLDPTHSSQDALGECLSQLGYLKSVFVTTDPHEYDLVDDIEAVFVFLGIEPNISELREGESNRLITYLANGGHVYLESGNFWNDPTTTASAVKQYFHITPLGPGQNDLSMVEGVNGTVMEGLQFGYSGANQSIDDLDSGQGSEVLMRNPTDGTGCAVGYNAASYKTIGASFQFGGLEDSLFPNVKKEYLKRVLDFFNPVIQVADSRNAGTGIHDFQLTQNYPNPFNASTTIRFFLPEAGKISLHIFNVLGEEVNSRFLGEKTSGWQEMQFDASGLNSGIYFYRLSRETGSGITSKMQKMILAK